MACQWFWGLALLLGAEGAARDSPTRRPNIVFLMLDDMDLTMDSLSYMPHVLNPLSPAFCRASGLPTLARNTMSGLTRTPLTFHQTSPATLRATGLPEVRKLLRDEGTTFTEHRVNEPICCPSRALGPQHRISPRSFLDLVPPEAGPRC